MVPPCRRWYMKGCSIRTWRTELRKHHAPPQPRRPGDPPHRRGADHAHFHRLALGQHRVFPVPDRHPVPAPAGPSHPARDQRGLRLPDERPRGRSTHAPARAARGDEISVQDLSRQDARGEADVAVVRLPPRASRADYEAGTRLAQRHGSRRTTTTASTTSYTTATEGRLLEIRLPRSRFSYSACSFDVLSAKRDHAVPG